MSDADYMRLALEEARAAARAGEVPVGAIVVRGGDVIARAHNRVESTGDALAHAEVLALRLAAQALGTWRLNDCTLYVTLEPCAMCTGAMVNARLGSLRFGAFEPRTGCCGSVLELADGAFLHTIQSVGGVLEEECAVLLRDFFEQRRG